MATWPSTLPLPEPSGYTLEPVDQTTRTDMEFGAARVRRRSNARNDKFSVSWFLRDAQMTIFRTWFDNPTEAAGGASWFTVNLAVGTGGVVSKEARFIGPFKAVAVGPINWSVSAELEVR